MPQASERAVKLAKEVLAKCMAYDPHFPNSSDATILAWAEHISLRNPTRDDMLAAVTKFYETNADGLKPLPASITTIARQINQDRMARGQYQPPRDKSDDPDEPEMPGWEKITLEEWERRHGVAFPKIALGLDIPDGPNPLRVSCPWCRASVRSPCVVPGTDRRIKGVHEARVALANGGCAPWANVHANPHSEECDRA